MKHTLSVKTSSKEPIPKIRESVNPLVGTRIRFPLQGLLKRSHPEEEDASLVANLTNTAVRRLAPVAPNHLLRKSHQDVNPDVVRFPLRGPLRKSHQNVDPDVVVVRYLRCRELLVRKVDSARNQRFVYFPKRNRRADQGVRLKRNCWHNWRLLKLNHLLCKRNAPTNHHNSQDTRM